MAAQNARLYIDRLKREMRKHLLRAEELSREWQALEGRFEATYHPGSVELRVAKGESWDLADLVGAWNHHQAEVVMFAQAIQAELAAMEIESLLSIVDRNRT